MAKIRDFKQVLRAGFAPALLQTEEAAIQQSNTLNTCWLGIFAMQWQFVLPGQEMQGSE